MVVGPAASASLGNLSEIQVLRAASESEPVGAGLGNLF